MIGADDQSRSRTASLEGVRRLSQFWSWLPAFRAVAESEHLPTAGSDLGVSPPALSRAVKLLEEALGHQLFERKARRIELSDAGRRFLTFVRDAMRRMDDGVQALDDATLRGPVRIAASHATSLVVVLPAVELLAARHPGLSPQISQISQIRERDASMALRKGELDLALVERVEIDDDLAVERLCTTTYGVYCAPGHALADNTAVTLEQCLGYPFVGRIGAESWPVNLRRDVALRVGSLALAVAACGSGRLLALLPDAAARLHAPALIRLSIGTLAEETVFCAHRGLLDDDNRVAVTLAALRDAL